MTKHLTRNNVTTGGIIFLTVAAFILSYDALRQLAVTSGVNWGLSWLYPLTLDAVAIVAALAVLRMTEHGDNKGYAWTLTIFFAALSIAGNVLHLDTGAAWYAGYVKPWLPYVVFSVPPVALILSFHLFTLQIENDIKRRVTVAPMTQPAQYKAPPGQVDTEPAAHSKPVAPAVPNVTTSAKLDTNQRRAVVKKEAHKGASKLAEQLGASVRTIYRDAEIVGVTLNGVHK